MDDDDTVFVEDESAGNAQLVGKDCELIRASIAVGVLADFDAIMSLAQRLHLVGIVQRFGDPKPPARVPLHADWLGYFMLGGGQFCLKCGRTCTAREARLRQVRRGLRDWYCAFRGRRFRPSS